MIHASASFNNENEWIEFFSPFTNNNNLSIISPRKVSLSQISSGAYLTIIRIYSFRLLKITRFIVYSFRVEVSFVIFCIVFSFSKFNIEIARSIFEYICNVLAWTLRWIQIKRYTQIFIGLSILLYKFYERIHRNFQAVESRTVYADFGIQK